MATVDEAFRVIAEREVLAGAAHLGFRVVSELEDAYAACGKAWRAFGEDYPDLDESFRNADLRIREAEQVMRDASMRLRYVGGY